MVESFVTHSYILKSKHNMKHNNNKKTRRTHARRLKMLINIHQSVFVNHTEIRWNETENTRPKKL